MDTSIGGFRLGYRAGVDGSGTGWTVGAGEQLADLHVGVAVTERVPHVPTDVGHLLEGLTGVFRAGSFSTAQHAQTADVHLHTVQHPTRDVVMMVMVKQLTYTCTKVQHQSNDVVIIIMVKQLTYACTTVRHPSKDVFIIVMVKQLTYTCTQFNIRHRTWKCPENSSTFLTRRCHDGHGQTADVHLYNNSVSATGRRHDGHGQTGDVHQFNIRHRKRSW